MQQRWEPTLSMIQLTEAQAARPQPPIDSATLSDPLPKMMLPFSTASINCPVLDSSMMSFNRSSKALQNQGCSEPFFIPAVSKTHSLLLCFGHTNQSKMIKHENKNHKDGGLAQFMQHLGIFQAKNPQSASVFDNTTRRRLQGITTCPVCSGTAPVATSVSWPVWKTGRTLLSAPRHNPQPQAPRPRWEGSRWFAWPTWAKRTVATVQRKQLTSASQWFNKLHMIHILPGSADTATYFGSQTPFCGKTKTNQNTQVLNVTEMWR